MPYQSPVKIKGAVENIRKQQYVLPSIQREFVWKTEQIERLFDSLMRGYPINTFLFWKIERENIGDFTFYKFLQHFHEKDGRHNPKLDLSGDEGVTAILDGQQRLTSIYIGLSGTYAARKKFGQHNNPNAFPKKRLYLNLLKKADEEDEDKVDFEYDFRFLTDKDAKSNDADHYWFPCGNILDFANSASPSEYLMNEGLFDTSCYKKENGEFALKTLNEFYNVTHQKDVISYYLEEEASLDKVLQVFIRTNSGGTELSYSDLLLSIATAEWKSTDARETIHEFVDDLNSIGDGFAFTKDFVLKSCLVLADLKNIKFSVNNFTRSNMEIIEAKWERISAALRSAVILISKFGYRRDNLTSLNAVIPIAYFIHFNDCAQKIVSHQKYSEDRRDISQWLARVLLKRTFGGTPDSIYPIMRDVIKESPGRFNLSAIIERFRRHAKTITFSQDDIEGLLDLEYGKAGTYCALTLLYPGLDFSEKLVQDHIHPKSGFHKTKMEKAGYASKVDAFKAEMNKITNLQLLPMTLNQEKLAKPFGDWLAEVYSDEGAKKDFLKRHFIKGNQSLEFSDFLGFTRKRRELLREQFEKILGVADVRSND